MKWERIKITLLALLFIVGQLVALDVAGGELVGDARGIYLSQDRENGTITAQGFALNPFFSIRDDFLDFSLELGATAAISFSEKLESFAGYNRYAAATKAGVVAQESLYLNRCSLKLNNRSGYFKLGYQELDSPYTSSQKDRLSPTTFKAFTYVNNNTFWNVKLVASHIYGTRGWDTRGESGMLEALVANDTLNDRDMEKNRLEKVGDHAVTAWGFLYSWEGVETNLWYYSMMERTQARLTNADYTDKPVEIKPGSGSYGDIGYTVGDELLTMTLAYQYAMMGLRVGDAQGVAAAKNFTGINQRLNGFQTNVTFGTGFFISAATNSVEVEKNSLSGRYINAWGGHPEYAAAEEYRMNRFENRKFSTIKTAVGYRGGEVAAGLSLTQFSGKKDKGPDASSGIIDATFSYQALSLLYEMQDLYKSDSTEKGSYNTLVKIQLTKQF